MTTLYGIRNCDTIRKARSWLDGNDVAYRFHDYRIDGIDGVPLNEWVERLGWEKLINRRGSTFRKLPDEARGSLDAIRALAFMRKYPAAIRRPVLVNAETLLVGFDPAAYAGALPRS